MDREDLQRQVWLRRGRGETREGEEVENAQQECQEKKQKQACKE